nr:HNH endonuclease family protein [Kitasatospora griseola]
MRAAIDALAVAAEDRTGYVRTAFRHWIDADKNGCDTRKEVLIAEAVTAPAVGAGCALTGGEWLSSYDDLVLNDASLSDVDHVVPLAESWDSGASTWSAAERQAYANDLAEPRALIAVSAKSNRAKADKDPAEWLPPAEAYRCTYLTDWVVVKTRWGLSVDPAEADALHRLAAGCPDEELAVSLAR